ncbi:rhodanese-like domain-containing protein [Robbsia sp. KACC 23696]|uniref:rhodanese-like domain-containing protein n=1 Tax=Robbsia sp. KACC 23696 TaxID=3149231 RepID=UPI00325B3861
MTADSPSLSAAVPHAAGSADTVDTLLARGRARAVEGTLPYAGAVTPDEAFALLQTPDVLLVDVRTLAELTWVGRPTVAAGQYAHIEWNAWPGGARNTQFVDQLRDACGADGTDRPVLLLCRSAARSKAAAQWATEQGFTQVFDVLEGFEGDKDVHGHRKSVGGWCARQLPWQGA